MKKIATILTLTFALALSAQAQIFIQEDEDNNRLNSGDAGVFVDLPEVGGGNDWYVPIGGGMVLLAAMGGAYLLGKQKKEFGHGNE